jgi:hypothetical protein
MLSPINSIETVPSSVSIPTRARQLIKTINDLGSVLEAAQRLILQVLGMAALIYLVIQAILR